jgi:hypothetical protein
MVHSMHLPQLDLYQLFHTTRRSIQFPAHLWKKNTPSDWWHSRYISDSFCATQNDPGIVYRPQNVLTVDKLSSVNKQTMCGQAERLVPKTDLGLCWVGFPMKM